MYGNIGLFGRPFMQIDYKDLFSFLTFLIAVVGFAMNVGKISQRVSVLETRATEDRGELKAIHATMEALKQLIAGELATVKQQIASLNSKQKTD